MKVDTGYASIWITVYFACFFFSRTYLVLHLILMFKWSVCPSGSRFVNAKKCQETNVLCFNVGKNKIKLYLQDLMQTYMLWHIVRQNPSS